jgi:hypothetical protein
MTPSQRHSARPVVEVLETRLVPAIADIQLFLNGRTLIVQGTNDPEQIIIQNGERGVGVFIGEITAEGPQTPQLFAIMPSRFVQQVKVVGRGGDDIISMINPNAVNPVTNEPAPSALTIPALIFAGEGNDTVTGGLGADTIRGMKGDDSLNGAGGNDKVFGGQGNDTMGGGAGRDRMFGEFGDDEIVGGVGNDLLFGSDGNDVMMGDENDDTLIGGLGEDEMNSGTGFDTLRGIDGFADTLTGADADDVFQPDALDTVARG